MITITVTGETFKEVLDQLLGAVDVAKANLDAVQSVVITAPTIPLTPTTSAATVAPAAPPAPPAPSTPVPPPPPPVPTAAPPAYSLEQITRAGADLLTARPDLMPTLMALLPKYGVQSLSELKQEQFGAVATELRALGANI